MYALVYALVLVTRLLLSVISLNFLCESLSSFLRSEQSERKRGEEGRDIHLRGKKMALIMLGSNEMVMTLREDVSPRLRNVPKN